MIVHLNAVLQETLYNLLFPFVKSNKISLKASKSQVGTQQQLTLWLSENV